MTDDQVELFAERMYSEWLESRKASFAVSNPFPYGDPLAVPWAEMDEDGKVAYRLTVRSVLEAVEASGYCVTRRW